ncbi:NUMOD4 motif-containing HNH endonuclease [Pseudomonas urmiensis]|uniref:NUMOD4 motif-containing HNH endonuclease n=1 Tax=Pseudomonas urmiensis TaxID=2745493 RepID=UPI003D0CACDD
MTEEIWKDIVGFEGYYQVSDLGRVRSVDRELVNSRGHNQRFPGVMIVITGDGSGYQKFLAHKAGAKKNLLVHTCVLEAFTGPGPDGYECCHGNGNRKDNRHSNLRWGTKAENAKDKELHGTAIKGAYSQNSKLTDQDVASILCSPDSHAQVAARHGVTAELVGLIRNGKAWKHIERQPGMYAKRKKAWLVNGKAYDTLPEAAAAEGIAQHVLRYKCQGRTSKGKFYPPVAGFGFLDSSASSEVPE